MALAPREVVILQDIFEPAPKDNIEKCVLELSNGKTLDIGALCYGIFEVQKNNSGWLVEVNSKDNRRQKFATELLNHLRKDRSSTDGTKRNTYLRISYFVRFINNNHPELNLESETDWKKAYKEYTKQLQTKIRLKDGNPNKLKNNVASGYQKLARLAVSLAMGINTDEVAMWATRITWEDNDSELLTKNPNSNEDMLKTHATHCELIFKAHEFFIGNKFEELPLDENKTTILLTRENILNTAKLDEFWRSFLPICMLSYIAASGSNLQQALEAELDNEEFDHEDKLLRYSGVKNRAKGKITKPTIAAVYLKFWKMYLELRSYYINRKGVDTNLVFPYFEQGSDQAKSINPNYLTTGRLWSKIVERNGRTPFTARPLRKLKTVLLEKVTKGDISLIADMQDHTVKTALRHYTSVTLQDAATEISAALTKVYESAVERSRTKSFIDVRLTETRDSDSETPVGECQSGDDLSPQLKEGFTDSAPQPDCTRPETCIFCEHYAAHADETDLRKLLSLRFLINELGTMSNAEIWSQNWAPFVERIEETVTEMLTSKPSLKKRVASIYEEVEIGMLDEYWRDWSRYLIDWGVIQS